MKRSETHEDDKYVTARTGRLFVCLTYMQIRKGWFWKSDFVPACGGCVCVRAWQGRLEGKRCNNPGLFQCREQQYFFFLFPSPCPGIVTADHNGPFGERMAKRLPTEMASIGGSRGNQSRYLLVTCDWRVEGTVIC